MQVSSLSYREWVGVGGRSKTSGTFDRSADLFRGQALSLIMREHPSPSFITGQSNLGLLFNYLLIIPQFKGYFYFFSSRLSYTSIL